MLRIFDYIIPHFDRPITVLNFLKQQGYSHAILVHLKKTPEGILRNGKWEYVNALLDEGDHLRIVLSEPEGSPGIQPISHPLTICYEDEDILVVNKPSGMPVHPSQGHYENTLANAVCDYFHEQGIPYTFRCVNRLDRDTTGLVILAKHLLSSAILNQAVARREIHREYIAIVDGITPENGIIDAPIGRKDASTIERQVDYANGQTAITHYNRLTHTDSLSLLSLHLETGRTHQIRVHMKHLGYPLIGDFLYHPDYFSDTDKNNESDSFKSPLTAKKIKRQALHSYRLQFKHPITGIPMDLTAPLPADMAESFGATLPAHMGHAPLTAHSE